MENLTSIEILNIEARSSYWVRAKHVEDLKTSKNYNGAIFLQSNGRYILRYSLNGRYESRDAGMYITEKQANEILAVSRSGKETDDLIAYFLS